MTLDLLTASGLTAAFSFLLALVFVLIPPARRWFVALDAETQQAVTGVSILVIAALAVSLGCFGVLVFIPCTAPDIGSYLLSVVFVAVIGDRTSKAVFAAARWQIGRGEDGHVKSLTQGRDGRLLY